MNLQKVDITIKQEWKQYLEDKEHPWTLGSPEIISTKKGNQSVSIATYLGTLQKNAEDQRETKR